MAELDELSLSLDELIAKRGEERKKQGQLQGRGAGRGRASQQRGGRGGPWQGHSQRQPGGRGWGRGPSGPSTYGQLPPDAFWGVQGTGPPFLPHREVFLPGSSAAFPRDAEPIVFAPQPPPVPPPQPPQLSAYVKPETQEVAVKFKQIEILKVTESGAVTLDSGGFRGPQFLLAMNEALKPLGMKISGPSFANWTISNGRSMVRYEDGVVLPASGAFTENRAKDVLRAFTQNPAARPAAPPPDLEEPPMLDDVIPNGVAPFIFMPPQLPPFPRGPGRGSSSQRIVSLSPNSQKWHSGNRDGTQQDRDRERRLKQQGRYTPY